MRTFEQGTLCRFPNEGLKLQAFEYAKSKGVPVFNRAHESYYKDYPCINFNFGELCGNKGLDNPTITIAQFFEYCDNWQEAYPPMVKISDEVNAVVNKQDEIVYFNKYAVPFDKINELHKLINQ